MTLRTCPICESRTSAEQCCGIDLASKRRWKMTPDRIKYVHALAQGRKGLSDETYRLRLAAVGVESSLQLNRVQYLSLIQGLAKLPDKPGYRGRRADAR